MAKERADEDVWRLIGELESVTARLREAIESAESSTAWLKDREMREGGTEQSPDQG